MFQCSNFNLVSKWRFIVGWIVAVVIPLTYLPEQTRIVRKGESKGLSLWYLFVGSISNIAFFVNMYLVTVRVRHCCSTGLNAYQCSNGLLNYIQVGLDTICYITTFLLFALYAGKVRNSTDQSPHKNSLMPKYLVGIVVYAAVNLVVCVCVVHVPSMSLRERNDGIKVYADISGTVTCVFVLVQYLPQIWTTYKLEGPGEISLSTYYAQCGGTYYWAYSIYVSSYSPGWSTYLPLFIRASLQAVLILMCAVYRRLDKRREARERRAAGEVENKISVKVLLSRCRRSLQ